jgi:hypothetical protein
MDKVIKSMNALRQMADNDIFAPVNFKLLRDYRNSSFAISGTYPIAMLKADETTSEVSEPIKAYYGYRMINRMLKNPDGNVDKVVRTVAGDTSGITTLATKTNNDVYVLLINNGTTAKTNYIVDYHNLWNSSFKNNNVFVREVSGDGIGTGTNNDEVVGTYALNASHQATIPSLPAQSAQLVVLRKNNNTSGGPPIHTLRAQTDSIEIWWNNYANVEDFNVYHSTSPSSGFTKIASHGRDAFYTDSTVSAQQNYYYQITSNNIMGEGAPGAAAGPIQIRSEDNTLPWKRDFENGSIAGITQVPGGSWIFRDDGVRLGYGIRNVDERIKLQFGSSYGVQLRSAPGAGTAARITIPVYKEPA